MRTAKSAGAKRMIHPYIVKGGLMHDPDLQTFRIKRTMKYGKVVRVCVIQNGMITYDSATNTTQKNEGV